MKKGPTMSQKLEISYPCEWAYTIIGKDRLLMREAVNSIIQPNTFELTESHQSSAGKYISLKVKLVVFSEEERVKYFKKLGSHQYIKMVL